MENKLRQSAIRYHQEGKLKEAEILYRKLLNFDNNNSHPNHGDAVNLGALLRTQQRYLDAANHYNHYLDKFPNSPELTLNAINLFIDQKNFAQAIKIGETFSAQNRENLGILDATGRALIAAGQFKKAQDIYQGLLKTHPNNLDYELNLGLTHFHLKRWSKAETSFDKICKSFPNDSRGYINLLITLKEQGKFTEASRYLAKMPKSISDRSDVLSARAALQMAEQKHADAEALLAIACEKDPDNAANWLNRAACMRNMKHNISSQKILQQAIKLHPGNSDLTHSYGQNLAELGRGKAAMKVLLTEYKKLAEPRTDYLSNLQFLGTGYQLMSSNECQDLARSWEEHIQKDSPGPLWADRQRDMTQNKPLRIGYLSADYCNHPVGRFFLPVLQNHRQKTVKCYGLNLCPHNDTIHQQFKEKFDHWIDLRFTSDIASARRISDLKLDILVELGGFTGLSRPGILVHRPAPVQLSYLGYCGPTYLKSVDGWIGDEMLFAGLNSTDREAHALHKLNGGYMAYTPQQLPDLLPPDHTRTFRFGCFNHARKLSKSAIKLFTKVLQAVPNSDLLLKSITFVEEAEQRRIRSLFQQEGLDPERLVIQPWVPGWENHMSMYRHMDVALDSLPYSGATTSCEALLMGVPVVSLAGHAMVERLSASVLEGAGLSQWIATDQNHYVNIACTLAKTQPKGRSLKARQQLRSFVQQSNLGRPERVARELETLYEQLI